MSKYKVILFLMHQKKLDSLCLLSKHISGKHGGGELDWAHCGVVCRKKLMDKVLRAFSLHLDGSLPSICKQTFSPAS